MDWISDPNAWIGLLTLIGLEIVLGVDNLVFTAILADRLPPGQRRQARMVGLSLALLMRLGLLAALSYLAQLTKPLIALGGFSFSGRDLILIGGGAFLLAKGTTELHERIDEDHEGGGRRRATPAFWQVIVQIILLDLVFSLDSIITAIGMVDQLSIMVIAVVVAVGVMILASGPLARFVSRRPTVVILCLGFLLLIGFSLITEGFGFHIPKAYLYAAIVFSVLVEVANELRRRNQGRKLAKTSRRERASRAILRVLAGASDDNASASDSDGTKDVAKRDRDERIAVQGVLELGERRLRSLMTPRGRVEWLDVTEPQAARRERILGFTQTCVLLAQGQVDHVVGVARTRDLVVGLSSDPLDATTVMHPPLVLPESLSAFRAIEALSADPMRFAIVVDEHGSVQGVVTPADILTAIAGGVDGERRDATPSSADGEANEWVLEGSQDVRQLGALIGHDLADEADRYATVAGLILTKLERLPAVGDRVMHDELTFDVLTLNGRNAGRVRVTRATVV